MIVSITNAVTATIIFVIIFLLFFLISIRRRQDKELFPNSVSQELKGIAILTVVFSHVGYFLMSDTRFLYPFTTLAGVGVNLFLFLSGYGLVVSSLKKNLSVLAFYKYRLLKLFFPFWIILGLFFLLDFFILKMDYGWVYVLRSFIGYFPHADLYQDVNSPLWYFTFILFYYFLFPLVFFKKKPWLSALLVFSISYFLIQTKLATIVGTSYMYNVHLLAFPLGMLLASLIAFPNKIAVTLQNIISVFQNRFKQKINSEKFFYYLKNIIYYLLIAVLALVIWYTAINSGVGSTPIKEELISLVTVFAFTLLFIIKRIEFKLLSLFGLYSYEIYLLHWPLMYRYDFVFKYLPPWLAMLVYLALFVGLSWGLKKLIDVLANLKFGQTKKLSQ